MRDRQLPPADRPELIVYGESLGSYGSEAHLAGNNLNGSITNITSQANGVL